MILILRETDFRFIPVEVNVYNINNYVKSGVMKYIFSAEIILFQNKENKIKIIKNRFLTTDVLSDKEYNSIDEALKEIFI